MKQRSCRWYRLSLWPPSQRQRTSTFKLTSFSSFSTMNLLDCCRGDNRLSRKQYWSIMCYDTYSYITVIRSRNLNLEFSPDHDRTYPSMIKQPMFASPCLHWDPQLKTSYAVETMCCWRWECNLFQSESGYPLCFWNSSSTLSLWVHMMGFLTTKMRDI